MRSGPAPSGRLVLGPLSVGEIADRAASLYRREFPLLFSTAFLPQACLYLITVLAMLAATGGEAIGAGTRQAIWQTGSVLVIPAAIFLGTLRIASLAAVCSDRYFGRPATLRGVFGRALRAWLRVFATALLGGACIAIGFLAGGIIGLFAALIVTSLVPDPIVGVVLGIMAFVPCLAPGFFFFLRFLFAAYIPLVPMVEGQWAVEGLGRSWRLMEYRSPRWGRFGTNTYRATALFILLLGIYLAVVFLAELPHYALLFYQAYQVIRRGGPMPTDPTLGAPLWLLIPAQSLAVAAQALVLPYTACVFTVYYYDLRARREGMDLFLETAAD